MTVPLFILGAVYGKSDITSHVRSLAEKSNGFFHLQANSQSLGDGWPNNPKSLIVVYQYGQGKPEVSIVQEGGTLNLQPPSNPVEYTTGPPRAFLQVLGAAWGLANVTDRVTSRIQNYGLDLVVGNEAFGETWQNVAKSFVLVFHDHNGSPTTVIATEGQRLVIQAPWGSEPGVKILNPVKQQQQQPVYQQPQISIQIQQGQPQQQFQPQIQPQVMVNMPVQKKVDQSLTILGAAWGKNEVTDKVRDMVKGGNLHIRAENGAFGDGWENIVKSLVIVYQTTGNRPQVAICKEGETIYLNNQGGNPWNPQPGALNVLGAAYGLANVTDKVAQRVQNNKLELTPDNGSFGDTWSNNAKSFVIVYQSFFGLQTIIAEEGQHLSIS